jgi:hypothetical protein
MTDDRRKAPRRKDDVELLDTVRQLGLELTSLIHTMLAALEETGKESVN